MAEKILKVLESERLGNNCNSMELISWGAAKNRIAAVNFEVDNPWAGSTETGFGYACSVTLDREDVRKVRDFLDEWLKAQ